MATYDPPQPIWKRNLAGILDFFLAFCTCVYLVSKIFGNLSGDSFAVVSFGMNGADFKLGGWSVVLAFALIAAYFVILGRTGGTVFQRLFGMKRVRRDANAPEPTLASSS
jgi:hypothetical protein